MSNVWPVLVGGFTTLMGGFIAMLTEDRKARRAEAAASERDKNAQLARETAAREQFQHETLLALQDALARLARTIGQIYVAGEDEFARDETWGLQVLPGAVNEAAHEAVVEVNRLRVRVRDAAVRSSTKELIDLSTLVALPAAREEPTPHTRARAAAETTFHRAVHVQREINERIGTLLRAEPN